MVTGDRERWIAQLIEAACCVVGADAGVGTITVVGNRRLPYADLARLRAHATACRADFVVDGKGTVVVRRAGTRSRRASTAPRDRG